MSTFKRLFIILVAIISTLGICSYAQYANAGSQNTPYTFMDSDVDSWEEFATSLLKTNYTPDANIVLKVSGYGGDMMTGNRVVQSLIDAEARGLKVHMDVVGPAYSMHAYLVCFGSDYKIESGGTLMYHQVFGVSTAFFGLIQYKEFALDPASEVTEEYMLNTCIAKGILTQDDKKNILNGKEVYITAVPGGTLKLTKDPDSILLMNTQNVIDVIMNLCILLLVLYTIVAIIRKAGK